MNMKKSWITLYLKKQEENPLLLLKDKQTADQKGGNWVQIVDQNNE